MTYFYNFIAKSQEITDPQGAGLDAVKPVVENFEAAIKHLKTAVRSFEQFDALSEALGGEDQSKEVDLQLI